MSSAAGDEGDPPPSRVLIAYATRYGSTAEVAQAIAKTLRERGVTPDVRDVHEAADLQGHDAVVFGAPFYFARMLGAGRRFLARQRRALAEMPVAVFVLGLQPEDKRQRRLERMLTRPPAIRPLSVGLFGAVVDGSKLRFCRKAPPIRKLLPEGVDTRDWKAIEEWARALPGRLGTKP